jgi:preprotein translocase subunit YajC
MLDPKQMTYLAGPAVGGDPFVGMMVQIVTIFVIFYFLWWTPIKNKQKKLETLQNDLKSGDKVILNPGIFGTVVGVEGDTLQVRIADQTKIKVLKSAIAGLQGQPTETEK